MNDFHGAPSDPPDNRAHFRPRSVIPLDGRLERARFPPILLAFLTLVLAFILFQGISLVASIGLIFTGDEAVGSLSDMPALLETHAGSIIVANTIGQVFGLLIPTLLIARLHGSDWKGLLRLRSANASFIVLSVIGLIALIPVVQWLGVVSESLPWPDFIREFEQAQMDLIERVLMQDFHLAFTLSMLALTPAICEEVLFRGYVQRQAERSVGAWGGVLISGIIFGLYHLRLTQALPLSVLGIFMAYLTWRSGSLLPAMIIHLANNGFAVILGKMASRGVVDVDTVETLTIPWYILLPAVVLLVAVIAALHKRPVVADRLARSHSTTRKDDERETL